VRDANPVCGASIVGMMLRLLLALEGLLLLACAGPGPEAPAPRVVSAPAPSQLERYCAWYADSRDGVLYFGESAFWSALRAAGGDPEADLRERGPQLIGRFDLERQQLLEPLQVAEAAGGGVWDVYAHRNGRIYFTTFFESMGWVDPRSGEVERLPQLGAGLNEIAAGPGDALLVSRYGPRRGRLGSVLLVSPDGERLAEHELQPPAGYLAAPKTVGFDAPREEIWATMDLIPVAPGAMRHDAYVIALDGRELRRIERPEIQFVAFTERAGFRAEVDGTRLFLHTTTPDGAERRILLDAAFAPAHDFVQDIQPAADGRVVVTRWSGWIHLLEPQGTVRTLRLPSLEPGGLYYSGVVTGQRVCATYCGGVRVVCAGVPSG